MTTPYYGDATSYRILFVPERLAVIERRHILTMLEYTSGNKRQAAQLLGISRSTLIAKVRRYQVENQENGSAST